ncbi:Sterol regulatory element-binding protein cleavage-activating like [Verticillium longisporum]|uniref:Sterol regulatory element-binding protein cleavage-activating like n=1 Tax=Verticillium longisporum TaxID=100787 RepID=A0A8I3AK75_VERLO|nr:Sterol regulatory element-binding protein cleavage-activating like [Verticillium longisporum]
MIWYLLYPLRGTTEAPVLTPSHPLRRAFARYGAYATRHVITTLLISTAVAAVLIYPFPFLYTTDFTNGASNLPHHVWTLAQPIEKATVEPDVVMRSVWVHGSYMQALDREVLLGALQLQDELLGPTENFDPRRPGQPAIEVRDHSLDMTPNDRDAFHVINGLTNQSWFFHSPLQYWYGSPERISSDADIISTVNERKSQPTSVNTTLRHSIVFSGKHFEDRRLLAADALVITLIHLRDSPVGRQWERKAAALATQMADKWTAYPADGSSMSNQLYEFQFQPMSIHDTIVLALAYGLSMLYFFVSMSKLRAVKSKTGLIVTVMTQIMLSILSSFTVCAVFKIDLSRIPQAAYPVVVLSMSLENIFRLINAVIATPSEHSTSSRIGHAFGDTAPIALASSLQNVLILWALSRVVSPGVSAFCTFAAVAIVFDFFYLSTFFLVTRRPSESAARASWTDALLQGKIAMSTRIAGTIIMVGFVLAAQWHFFENQTILRVLGGLFRLSDTKSSLTQQKESFYIAQVYDPLVFVLKAVRLFMSYLLWKEDAEFKSGHDFDTEPLTEEMGPFASRRPSRPKTPSLLFRSPLVSVKPLAQSSMSDRDSPLSVLTASKKGCIHVANQQDQCWTSVSLDMHSLEDRDASQVVPLPGLDCFLVARQHSVDLVDGKAYRLLHVFETGPIQPQTLRAFHSARRKPQCGSVGLISFGLAYNDSNTGDCVIQTYLPKEDGDTICFRDSSAPASRSCCKWPDTIMSQRRINNPGTWEALSGGFIVGVRRDQPLPARYSPDSSPTTQGLRRRIYSFRQDDRPGLKLDKWEIWVASHSGRHDVYETMPLHSDDELGGCLMISELGPMVKVGTASVVVGFGTILKLITVGHEHFEVGQFAAKGQELLNIGSRRRKPGPGTFRARANVWDKSQ